MGCTAAKPVKKRSLPVRKTPESAQKPAEAPEKSADSAPEPSEAVRTQTPMNQKPVLHYFDCYGRAEVIRLLLHYLGIDFKDVRFTNEEWAALKPRAEFEMAPYLDIDGHVLSQTRAILRYICYKKGLYPAGKEQTYLTESLCDLIEDMRGPLIDAARAGDIVKVAQAKVTLPERLKYVEKRLLAMGDGKVFFGGKSPNIADFLVFNFLWDNYLCEGRNAQDELPKPLLAYATRMSELPRLDAYLRSRPARPY